MFTTSPPSASRARAFGVVLAALVLSGCASAPSLIAPPARLDTVPVEQRQRGTLGPDSPQLASGHSYARYEVEAQAGQSVAAMLFTSAETNGYLIVDGPRGHAMYNDDCAPSERQRACLAFLAPAAGRYVFTATTRNAGARGDYELVTVVGGTTGAARPADQTIRGALTPQSARMGSKYVNVHMVPLRGGQDTYIWMQADGFDGYLLAQGPGGALLRNDDCTSGDLRGSCLRLTPRENGVWKIGATTYSGNVTGAYEIRVAQGDAAQQAREDYAAALRERRGQPAQVAQQQGAQQQGAQQQGAQQQGAQQSGRRGGLIRGVIGAGLGAAAAVAHGANASQTVGAMITGAAMVNPDAEGSAEAAAVGQQLIQGNAASAAAALATGQGGQQGAAPSGPAAPNLAMGAHCPGFTMANYRDRAVNSPTDRQLFTMCGQAFEYYRVYLDRRAQGLATADQAYGAHRVAAVNAQSFYRNNRDPDGPVIRP